VEINLIIILDIIGIISFSLSGYIIAVKEKLDILGIFIISSISAFGGGFIRDLSVNKTSYVFTDTYPLVVVLSVICFSFFFKVHKIEIIKLNNNNLFMFADSIGLVIFSYTGSMVALETDYNLSGVLFLSLLTGIGGSIIRDVFLNKTPYFLLNEFYGTVSIYIGLLLYSFQNLNLLNNYTISFILISGFLLRIIAIKRKWKLFQIT